MDQSKTNTDTCVINLEVDVIDLLRELRKKRSPRRERIYHDYLQVKEYLGRRPTYKEVHKQGKVNSREYRQVFGGYFSFLKEFGELSKEEEQVYKNHFKWFVKVEQERMTKSYKMVVLQYLLNKGPKEWFKPVTPHEVAPYFHQFYMSKEYRKKIDFSNQNTKRLWDYDKDKVAQLIAHMPMSKWVDEDELVLFEEGAFKINFPIAKEEQTILHRMTEQICDYKMHVYFERRID